MTVLLRSDRGVALIVTLLAMTLFGAVATGLSVSAVLGRAVSANYEEAVELENASDSAVELAARELGAIVDWNEVLAGGRTSTLVDGPPGHRAIGGLTIDLPGMTNELSCGRSTVCTDAQVRLTSADRPWGANNPRWRLFIHMALPALPAMSRPSGTPYVVVWVGDDARETDGDPVTDGGGASQEGRHVVRARVESFGMRGGRHALEAELARLCRVEAGVEVCSPGVRVHSVRLAAAIQ